MLDKTPSVVSEAEKAAADRASFVWRAVERIGGAERGAIGLAARELGVTSAAIHRWANVELSVEAAILLAEKAGYDLKYALRFASRRLGPASAEYRRKGPRLSPPAPRGAASPP